MQSKYDFDYEAHRETLVAILTEIIAMPKRPTGDELSAILRRHPRQDDRSMHSRTQLVQAYRKFAGQYGLPLTMKSKCLSCAASQCGQLAALRLSPF